MNNKYNIPEWLKTTIEWSRSNYTPGSSDYTTTSLLKPARIYALEKLHRDEVEEEVSDNFASFFGDCIHTACESALIENDRYIVEERFYRLIEVDGRMFKVGGQIDLYDKEIKELSDHKFTSVAKLMFGDKADYESQLAINRWLLRGWGLDVDSCKINLFLKDWRKGESKKNPEYPPIPFVELSFPLWQDVTVEDFIRQQIHEKESALRGFHTTCTEEERWTRPTKWALMKKGAKRAVKLYDTEEGATDAAGKGMFVEYRPGEDIRCDSYCPVNQFCDYYINKSRIF
jgi:hypothetical protein